MAERKLRLGIIGASARYGWGMRAHLPAIKSLPEFELAALCTSTRETAEASAAHYGAAKAYWEYNKLAADPDIDIVDVCVRAPLHHQMVMAALRAGKHVYCEWPLGANSAQAEEMANLAKEKNLKAMVGLQARGSAGFIRMKELVEEGYVGQVVSCSMTQFLPGTMRPRSSRAAWSADRAAGVNALSIATGHAIDIFCWCVGEFADLSSIVSTQVKQWKLTDSDRPANVTSPDDIAITGRLASGAVASVHVASIPWHGAAFRMEVYGTGGTLVATSGQMVQFVDPLLQGARADEEGLKPLDIPERLRWASREVPEGAPLNVAQMLARLAQAVREDKQPAPNFDEAVRRHHLLDTIAQASEEKAWVKVG